MVIFLFTITTFGQTPFRQASPVHYHHLLLAGVVYQGHLPRVGCVRPPRPALKKVGGRAGLPGDSPSLVKPITRSPSPFLKTAQIKASFPWRCLQPARTGGQVPDPLSWGSGSSGDGGDRMGQDGRGPGHLPSSSLRSRVGYAAGSPASSAEGHGEARPGEIAQSQEHAVAEP